MGDALFDVLKGGGDVVGGMSVTRKTFELAYYGDLIDKSS